MNDATNTSKPDSRRDFLKRFFCGLIGTVLGLVPFGAGMVVFLDPLRRKSSLNDAVRVASIEALPADGIPRKFPVLATRVDAWNKFPQVPVGAVYLRRTGDKTVKALNVICPHAGGFVDYVADCNCFICPLHNSKFALDGRISDPKSPAPRAMDALEVDL